MCHKNEKKQALPTITQTACAVEELSPLTLAFVGDGVYELYIREYLVSKGNRPVDALHKESVQYVNAAFQAKVGTELLPAFSSKEQEIFKRGRNAQAGHKPKNMSVRDYTYATALETVIGYLYLKGELQRVQEIMNEIIKKADTLS